MGNINTIIRKVRLYGKNYCIVVPTEWLYKCKLLIRENQLHQGTIRKWQTKSLFNDKTLLIPLAKTKVPEKWVIFTSIFLYHSGSMVTLLPTEWCDQNNILIGTQLQISLDIQGISIKIE